MSVRTIVHAMPIVMEDVHVLMIVKGLILTVIASHLTQMRHSHSYDGISLDPCESVYCESCESRYEDEHVTCRKINMQE